MDNIDLRLNDIEGINMSLDTGVKIIEPDDGGNYNNIYSLEETIIGIWLDKPLYRKIVDCGVLPDNNSIEIKHGITNLGRIVNFTGTAVRFDNDTLPIPYTTFNEANFGGISTYVDANKIVIRTVSNRSGYNAYMIIEYTKSTD